MSIAVILFSSKSSVFKASHGFIYSETNRIEIIMVKHWFISRYRIILMLENLTNEENMSFLFL